MSKKTSSGAPPIVPGVTPLMPIPSTTRRPSAVGTPTKTNKPNTGTTATFEKPSAGAALGKNATSPQQQSNTAKASVNPTAPSAPAPLTTSDGTQKLMPPPPISYFSANLPSVEVMTRRPILALTQYIAPVFKIATANDVEERRRSKPGPKYNNGYDDSEGHYIFVPGEEILGRFVIQEVLGKGSFGVVMRAIDLKNNDVVAVKITRSGSYFINQAKIEVDMLLRVNNNPRLANLVAMLRKYLMWQGHAVLVFQLLSFNLYQLVKLSKYNGVSLDLTRKFAFQILQVLVELEKSDPPIIHCDLKPENILLFDQSRSGIRVIDFGSACFDSASCHKHRYVQSRYYRSPEVIIGLPYGTAVDRWSLGCILVEMHTGNPVFPGRTEAEQLSRMEAMFGPVPDSMLAKAEKAKNFYAVNGSSDSSNSRYTLTNPPTPQYPTSLADVLGVYAGGPRGNRLGQPGHDVKSYEDFEDFIAHLLIYDPSKRIGCIQALQHPFITPLLDVAQMRHQQHEATAVGGGDTPSQPTAATPGKS